MRTPRPTEIGTIERRFEAVRRFFRQAVRRPLPHSLKKVGPEKAEAMLQTAEQGFKENYALLKKLSEM